MAKHSRFEAIVDGQFPGENGFIAARYPGIKAGSQLADKAMEVNTDRMTAMITGIDRERAKYRSTIFNMFYIKMQGLSCGEPYDEAIIHTFKSILVCILEWPLEPGTEREGLIESSAEFAICYLQEPGQHFQASTPDKTGQ
jgi:hypothetical protein